MRHKKYWPISIFIPLSNRFDSIRLHYPRRTRKAHDNYNFMRNSCVIDKKRFVSKEWWGARVLETWNYVIYALHNNWHIQSLQFAKLPSRANHKPLKYSNWMCQNKYYENLYLLLCQNTYNKLIGNVIGIANEKRYWNVK